MNSDDLHPALLHAYSETRFLVTQLEADKLELLKALDMALRHIDKNAMEYSDLSRDCGDRVYPADVIRSLLNRHDYKR